MAVLSVCYGKLVFLSGSGFVLDGVLRCFLAIGLFSGFFGPHVFAHFFTFLRVLVCLCVFWRGIAFFGVAGSAA